MSNEVKFDTSSMTWTQMARNKQRENKGERSVNVPLIADGDSLYRTVESFGEFVAESGGDIKTSILAAMDDLQEIAKNWVAKVDRGSSEENIKLAGVQLKSVIELYKALESYYVTQYEYQHTGTAGD